MLPPKAVPRRCCQRFAWARNWICFCLMGLINNVEYCVVTSAAKTLSQQFGTESYFGYILFANIALGILSQFANAFLLQKVQHVFRIMAMAVSFVLGLCGIAFSAHIFSAQHYPETGFLLVVFFVTMISAASALGESLLLGYMRIFDQANVVGGWGTGTGLAGIVGAGLYLIFRSTNMPMVWRFLFFVPFIWAYMLIFAFGVNEPDAATRKKNEKERERSRREKEERKALLKKKKEETTTDRSDSEDETDHKNVVYSIVDEVDEHLSSIDGESHEGFSSSSSTTTAAGTKANKCGTCTKSFLQRLCLCLRHCWFASANLFLVYWFEYIISTALAEKLYVMDPDHPDPKVRWALRNNYEILQFCYQIGVLISRSSIRIVRIRCVWIFTAIQFINMIAWFFIACFGFLSTNTLIWLTFPFMIFVGLLGGGSYVNCYYLILNNENLEEKDREFSANLTAITNTLGITVASVTTIILDATLFKKHKKMM